MNGFFDDIEYTLDHDNDYCSAYYYHHFSFAPTIYQLRTEFIDTIGMIMDMGMGMGIPITITTVDILRCLLILSVCLFLCTAVLLQGTLLELGMVRCRRTLGKWNAVLTNSCRRLA